MRAISTVLLILALVGLLGFAIVAGSSSTPTLGTPAAVGTAYPYAPGWSLTRFGFLPSVQQLLSTVSHQRPIVVTSVHRSHATVLHRSAAPVRLKHHRPAKLRHRQTGLRTPALFPPPTTTTVPPTTTTVPPTTTTVPPTTTTVLPTTSTVLPTTTTVLPTTTTVLPTTTTVLPTTAPPTTAPPTTVAATS